jgi:hypothetical protein
MDSMSNFGFLLEDDDIENEHEHDATSCEQWAHGKENPLLMTFQPN